jgi:hypothetical protein
VRGPPASARRQPGVDLGADALVHADGGLPHRIGAIDRREEGVDVEAGRLGQGAGARARADAGSATARRKRE